MENSQPIGLAGYVQPFLSNSPTENKNKLKALSSSGSGIQHCTTYELPSICLIFFVFLSTAAYLTVCIVNFQNSATSNTHMFTSHVSSPAAHPMTTSAFSALARRVRIMNNAPSCSRRRGSSSPSTLPAHIKTMGRWDDMRITIHLFGYTMIAFCDH